MNPSFSVQWFSDTKKDLWKIGIPQFKYCKKKKEHYSTQFPTIWYKAPYKYNVYLTVCKIMYIQTNKLGR